MPDFGSRWECIEKKSFDRGGQGRLFRVRDRNTGEDTFVAKVLNGADLTKDSPRWKRLEQEIEISKSFDHPHVVKVIDSGQTADSGYPFFVMPHYSLGSLEKYRQELKSPVEILELFVSICEGVAHVHSKPIVHRDLKPANIFMDENHNPIVGDFGICFRFGAESLTEPMEVAAARWFGAPELRDGHLDSVQPNADIYSLGKLLYWLFTGKFYDREDYGTEERKLSGVLRQYIGVDHSGGVVNDEWMHAGAFVDEIVSESVRYEPSARIQYANQLGMKTLKAIARLKAGGRALDLTLPLRCVFCGNGQYKPLAPLPPLSDKDRAPAIRVLSST